MFKILLADDSEADIFFTKEILNELNPNIIIDEVYNGEEAIEKIESGYVPDLILLDIKMPKVSGKELS